MDISIIIPTYNEVENVELTFNEINKRLKTYKYEIIFVDDNSQDGTQENIKQLKIRHENIVFLERKNIKGLWRFDLKCMLKGHRIHVFRASRKTPKNETKIDAEKYENHPKTGLGTPKGRI